MPRSGMWRTRCENSTLSGSCVCLLCENTHSMMRDYQVTISVGHGGPKSHIGSHALSAAGSAVASGVLLPFAVSVTHLRKLLLAIILLDIPLHIGILLFWSEELGAGGAVGVLVLSVTPVGLLSLFCLF